MYKNLYFKKLYCLILLLNISILPVFAQGKRGNVSSNQTKQSAPKCSGAWTGVITYTQNAK